MAVLVEDLDAVVLAIAHEKASLGVERQGVRNVEFAGALAFFSPGFYKFPGLIEFHDAGVGGWRDAMTVGDKNIAIGSDGDFGGLIKGVRAGAGNTGFPECK